MRWNDDKFNRDFDTFDTMFNWMFGFVFVFIVIIFVYNLAFYGVVGYGVYKVSNDPEKFSHEIGDIIKQFDDGMKGN